MRFTCGEYWTTIFAYYNKSRTHLSLDKGAPLDSDNSGQKNRWLAPPLRTVSSLIYLSTNSIIGARMEFWGRTASFCIWAIAQYARVGFYAQHTTSNISPDFANLINALADLQYCRSDHDCQKCTPLTFPWLSCEYCYIFHCPAWPNKASMWYVYISIKT